MNPVYVMDGEYALPYRVLLNVVSLQKYDQLPFLESACSDGVFPEFRSTG